MKLFILILLLIPSKRLVDMPRSHVQHAKQVDATLVDRMQIDRNVQKGMLPTWWGHWGR